MTWTADELAAFVTREFSALANPEKAAPMAAYLKTDMPFYGVQKQGRTVIARAVKSQFAITTADEYVTAVETLWALPHREEKYLALGIATRYTPFIVFERLPLYRRLIVEGAWWDLVDDVAARCIGHLLLHQRDVMRPELDRWIDDDIMWIRRTALIAHLKHKADTDEAQLFGHCLRCMGEKEFFIRKAIGWALREYAKTNPESVRAFAVEHRDAMSGLSFREATKYLDVGPLVGG